jgi:hypothetical protein
VGSAVMGGGGSLSSLTLEMWSQIERFSKLLLR